ncbi:MAG: hypothetical protein PVI81_04560 [Anaerolineales bacterium]|jgi:hypothetical protein
MSGSCSKAIAVFFGILFIFSVLLGVFLYQIEFVLLQPEPYVEAIQEGNLPERLTAIASHELAVRLERDPCTLTIDLCSQLGGPPAYLAQLSQQEWKQILDLLITPEWISEQAEEVVRGLFQWLEPGGPSSAIVVDLQPIKGRMGGETGAQVITLMLTSLPPCSQDQIAQLSELLLSGGNVNQLLVCSPPPEIIRMTLPILNQQMSAGVAEIPDQVSVDLSRIGAATDSGEQLAIHTIRRSLSQGLLVSTVLAAVSILMLVVFAVRSLKDLFVWIGWPLLSTGIIALMISLGVRASSGLIFSTFVGFTEVPMFQPETLDFVRELVRAVIGNLLRGSVFLSAGLAISGGCLLIISRLLPGRAGSTSISQRPRNFL